MLWNVKNALNPDVERQHLNKILAEIRGRVDGAYELLAQTGDAEAVDVYGMVGGMVSGNTENGITVSYRPTTKKLDFQVKDFTITLTGDATGQGTVSSLGDVTIPVSIDVGDFVEEAPNDGSPYWRQAEQWQVVPEQLWYIEELEPGGIPVLDLDYNWVVRQIESANVSNIVVLNGDGIAANPTINLAEVEDDGTGEVLAFTRDGYGRVIGTRAVTTDDLEEGTTNLYFTDQRATAAVGAVILDTGNILLDYDGTNITADLSEDVLASLALADSALQDAPSDGEQYARQDGAWEIVDLPPGYTYADLKASLVPGTNITITPDDIGETLTIAATSGGDTGTVDSVVAGTGIVVDSTDPANPVVTALVKIPFFLASGTRSDIPLTSNSKIPFFLVNGTASNIPLET